jgi:dihydroxy-acid dehydratase
MPGCVMAIARLNRPAVFVYGGTILPGMHHRRSKAASWTSSPSSRPSAPTPTEKLTTPQLAEIESCAIPGPGSCGGMYTANTMASAIEALGMSLPNSSAQTPSPRQEGRLPARRRRRRWPCSSAASAPRHHDPRAFENAITVVIALGGSTNAVLHLLAMAHAAGVKLGLDDFTKIGKRVPVLADLKPSGKYLMSELVAIGGISP